MEEKKITLDEFWASRDRGESIAIHCDTEEKARTLLTAFDNMGKTWHKNGRYTEGTYWEHYKTDTVYYNDCLYGKLDWAYEKVVPVYKFEEVDLQNYLNKKYPITLDEFWGKAIEKKLCIHCDTPEKARTLLTAFDKMGKRWSSGARYTDKTEWNIFGRQTVYVNHKYCPVNLDWAYEEGVPIYEFEEVDLTKYLDNDNQNEQEKGE